MAARWMGPPARAWKAAARDIREGMHRGIGGNPQRRSGIGRGGTRDTRAAHGASVGRDAYNDAPVQQYTMEYIQYPGTTCPVHATAQ